MGPGPSFSSWMAWGSTDGWKVESPNSVSVGMIVEVGESTARADSSSSFEVALELAATIGCRPLTVLVD